MQKSEFLLNKLDDDVLAQSDKESDLEIEFEPSSPAIKLDENLEKPQIKEKEKVKNGIQAVESLIMEDEDYDKDGEILNQPEEEVYGVPNQ